jgi:hypothetical protein
MLRALGALVAASTLVLSTTATASAPVTPKPTLVEIEGKPSGYALGVTPLDRPDVCGAKKVRLRLGTNMALSLATWLSAPAPQGPSPTVSVSLVEGTQRVSFSGAKVVRVELPVTGPQSNGPVTFVVDVDTQSTACSTVAATAVTGLENQAARLAARSTAGSAARTRLDGKPLTLVSTSGSFDSTRLGDIRIAYSPSEAQAIVDWVARINERKTVEIDSLLVDGAGAQVLAIVARVQAPSANGRTLELKADQLRVCIFVGGQRVCPREIVRSPAVK